MIEIKIPTDIRKYEDQLFFNLTFKHIVYITICAFVNVPLYLFLLHLCHDSFDILLLLIKPKPYYEYTFLYHYIHQDKIQILLNLTYFYCFLLILSTKIPIKILETDYDILNAGPESIA